MAAYIPSLSFNDLNNIYTFSQNNHDLPVLLKKKSIFLLILSSCDMNYILVLVDEIDGG